MLFDGTDADLADFQAHVSISPPPHLPDAGPTLDAVLLAGASAAPFMAPVSAILAAPAEEFGTGDEGFPGLDALDASAEPETGPALGDYLIEPFADLEPIGDVQHSDGTTIYVTGTRPRTGVIYIITDTSLPGETPVPLEHEVLHAGEGGVTAETLAIGLEGSPCPAEKAAATGSLQSLYDNSHTARALIERAAAAGVNINLITAHLSGTGAQPGFEPGVIRWDPYLAISGNNTDGSRYTLTPIMVLAHELVHAANMGNPEHQGANAEVIAISVANQIAREMNAASGTNYYDTTRNSHGADLIFYTLSSMTTTPSIVRPGCN